MIGNLPKPIKRQREVLYLRNKGHSAVLGTAGSGKTTLALYRAAYLSAQGFTHSGKTLLLTFNKTLVTYLKFLQSSTLKNVQIETYHKFARGYLSCRDKMKNNCICDNKLRKELIEKAIIEVSKSNESSKFFKRPIEFFLDEIKWISSHGYMTEAAYVEAKRRGRIGTKLDRSLRPRMYKIFKEYLTQRNREGKHYDWDDIAYYVKEEIKNDKSERRYRHIVIDEGQDFSPEMLRSLAVYLPENGSLTFFGDVAQQIYGQRMSWRSANLNIAQVWQFRENYRNTMQIARLGLAISRMPYFKEIEDMVEPSARTADGAPPSLIKFSDKNQQIDFVVKKAISESSTQSVAVLGKTWKQMEPIITCIDNYATKLDKGLSVWENSPGIFYGTYNSAKGLEFDTVILPFLDAGNLPDLNRIETNGEEDALTLDGRLLYVAVTRAKANLILLYSGSVTPLLPDDKSLYLESEQ